MFENQHQDGGWRDPWYGFSSTPEWGDIPESNEHTTLLALWGLHQVKYAHPQGAVIWGNLSPTVTRKIKKAASL